LRASHRKKGKREYLNDAETKILLEELNAFFETRVEVKRIRNGEHQTLETPINEEAQLFAKYLRSARAPGFPGFREVRLHKREVRMITTSINPIQTDSFG
jgi:hypothetical protein